MVKIPLQAETRSGGCQCGAVRYAIEGAPGRAVICHCRMCQKAFGNFGAALIAVPGDCLSWTRGKPSEFRSSAIVARGFCAACGTPLYMREDGGPEVEIAIGTLDDPNDIAPLAEQSGIESKVAWFDSLRELPGMKTTDYRPAGDMRRLASLQHPDLDTEHWP